MIQTISVPEMRLLAKSSIYLFGIRPFYAVITDQMS